MPVNSLYYKVYSFLICLLIVGLPLAIYFHWQTLLTMSQLLQREFHKQLTLFLMQVADNPWRTGFLLTGLSLIYGVLHSAGPGHGKFIITTYLATQPSKLKRSLYLTLFSAIMQGVVAISLVTLLLIIFKLSTHQVTQSEYWLEFSSYFIIIIMGAVICYRTIYKMKRSAYAIKANHRPEIISIQKVALNQSQSSHNMRNSLNSHCAHQHSDDCGCGHRHLPTNNELNQTKHWYSDLIIIISIGLRPCSGALLVLLFSYVIGVYTWGIIATIAMSIGTAITTSCFALLVYFARRIAEKLVRDQFNQRLQHIQFFSYFLVIGGGILFMIVGLLLMMGLDMQPAAINPLFH